MVVGVQQPGGGGVGDDKIVTDRQDCLVGPAAGGQEFLEQGPLPPTDQVEQPLLDLGGRLLDSGRA
jgi:hypothetical protein